MDSNDLTLAQAEAMRDKLIPYVRYLYKLRQRMVARGFTSSDPLYRATDCAYDAAQELTMKLHYLSCGSGVGKSAKEGPRTEG